MEKITCFDFFRVRKQKKNNFIYYDITNYVILFKKIKILE